MATELHEYKVRYSQTEHREVVIWATSAEDAERQVADDDLTEIDLTPPEMNVVDWERPFIREVIALDDDGNEIAA